MGKRTDCGVEASWPAETASKTLGPSAKEFVEELLATHFEMRGHVGQDR